MSTSDRTDGKLKPLEGFIAFIVFLVILLGIFLLLGIDPRGTEVGPLPWMVK